MPFRWTCVVVVALFWFGIGAVSATPCKSCSLMSPGEASSTAEGAEFMSRSVVEQLQSGKTDELWGTFTPKMQGALSPAQLKGVWPGLTGQFGALERIGDQHHEIKKGLRVETTVLDFERGKVKMTCSFDGEKLAGLFFAPN